MSGSPDDARTQRASDTARTLIQWKQDLLEQRPDPDSDDVDPVIRAMITPFLASACELLTKQHTYYPIIKGIIDARSWSLRTAPAILGGTAKALCITYGLNDKGMPRRRRGVTLRTPTKSVTARVTPDTRDTQ